MAAETKKVIQSQVECSSHGLRHPEGEQLSPATVSQGSSTSLDKSQYPPLRQSLLVIISLCLTIFCVSLDETILATAIPRITDEFHSLEDVGWYGSSFLFVLTVTQMTWGKVYTMYSTKWVFLLGIGIFEIGSLICGLARSSVMLIVGRSVAGLGSGSINAGAILIVNNTIPLRKRPIYLGLLGCAHGVMSVAGPLLGGVLTDRLSWRWCFYINLPAGAITFIAIVLLLSPNKPLSANLSVQEQLRSMDLLGSLIFVPGIVTLLLALQWGGSKYPWSDWRIILLFVLFGLLMIAFATVEVGNKDRAMLCPRIVCNRDMLGIIWYSGCTGGALYIFIYYLPIWFQAIKGSSATQSGLMILPTELGLVFSSLAGGVLVTVVGFYTPFLLASSVMSTIGAGILSTFRPPLSVGSCLGYQIVLSAGIGLGIQNVMLVPSVAFTGEDAVMAVATLWFVKTLAGSIALPIGESIFHNRLVENLQTSAPSVNISVAEQGATLLRETVPPEHLGIVLEAYSRAITQTFYVGVAMCGLSLIGSSSLQWKPVRDRRRTNREGNPGVVTSSEQCEENNTRDKSDNAQVRDDLVDDSIHIHR